MDVELTMGWKTASSRGGDDAWQAKQSLINPSCIYPITLLYVKHRLSKRTMRYTLITDWEFTTTHYVDVELTMGWKTASSRGGDDAWQAVLSPLVFFSIISLTKFSKPKTSSNISRRWWTFSMSSIVSRRGRCDILWLLIKNLRPRTMWMWS